MQSIKLKYAKIGVLGGPINALHGIRKLTLYLFLILALSGCVWFSDNRIAVKPEIDTTSPKYKEMLSIIINNRYDSEILRIAAADRALQEYLLTKDNEEAIVANPKSPDF